MSETAPERPPSRGGNILTRKVGPLPLWGWMAVGLAAAIAYYLYNKNKAASSSSATSTGSTTSTTASSSIPQFVNQVYTNGTPPSSPNTRGGTEGKGSSTTPTGSQTNWSNPYIVAVPNGTGGWEEAVFPNQDAVNNFYSDIGYNNGYPLGLNKSQIGTAVTKAGGNVAGTVANSGPGGLVQ